MQNLPWMFAKNGNWRCPSTRSDVTFDQAACERQAERPRPEDPEIVEAAKVEFSRHRLNSLSRKLGNMPKLIAERRKQWELDLPNRLLRNEGGGLVYFVDCLKLTKIGFTSGHVRGRIEGWATGNPYELRIFALIPGPQKIENEMHRLFKAYRHRPKREWFKLSPKARQTIECLAKERGGAVLNMTIQGTD